MPRCASIRPNNCSNSYQSRNTVHLFGLIASCINPYDDLLNSFCRHGEVEHTDKVLLRSVPSAVLRLSNYWYDI